MSERDDLIMDLRLLHLESKIERLKAALEAIKNQPSAAGRISRQALEPHHPLEG